MADLNTELNSYGIPEVNLPRHTFHYKKRVKTTGNVGEIIPIYTNVLVQPGDTFKIGVTDFERLTTSKFPTMDNLYRNIYAFSCSWLALWNHANEFWGENTDANFNVEVEYTVPKFVIDADSTIGNRSILNRLGVPHMTATAGRGNINYARLAYNMYIHIYNNFFRDQNYIPAISFSKGDEDITYSTFTGPKDLLKAARFHDYFSTIPEPQFGEQVRIAVGESANVSVFGNGKPLVLTDGTRTETLNMHYYGSSTNKGLGLATGTNYTLGQSVTESTASPYNLAGGVTTDGSKSGLVGIADLSTAIGASIEALRYDICIQRIKERLAWYGRLYQNIVYSMWGVSANKENLRLPIFLGADRAPLNMDTVLQTSSTDATSPQGEPAGYSATLNDGGELFTKSFTEHSVLMILAVVRQDHTYSQGINCQYQKFRKYDFFWNELAGLGAQDIKMSEIYVDGSSQDSEKWGCKPAWQEYRVEPDEVTGQLAPKAVGTLVNYTYADSYDTAPVNGKNWIEETDLYVDRTLTTQSSVADQIMFDFTFDIIKTTEVSTYNLPGIERI